MSNKPLCHGTNQVACRPDPSPHGKDCQTHGRNGGPNDDHCGTETQPSTTTTTTTAQPVPTPTTTFTTGDPTTAPPAGSSPTTALTASPVPTSLAYTGAGTDILAGIGTALLVFGVLLLRKVKRQETEARQDALNFEATQRLETL